MKFDTKLMLVSALPLVLFSSCRFGDQGRSGKAHTDVESLCVAVISCVEDNSSERLFGNAQHGLVAAVDIVDLLRSNDGALRSYWDSRSVIDPWGRPYYIAWSVSEASIDVHVWSAGPNGVNEFGFGDDISKRAGDGGDGVR